MSPARRARSAGGKPSAPVRIRMYNVGFGDCFLLTFPYADADRHVLVDFGSTRLPKAAPKGWMTRIAKDIQKECGNKPLDAIVVSHRHKDHLNGFSGEPAEVIDALDPQLVVQPWTEDPKARHDAREARLVQGLHEAQTLVAHVIAEAQRSELGSDRARLRAAGDVGEYGELNLSNEQAVKNLKTWGADQGRGEFLHHGARTRLEQRLPGVGVKVLGPPTLAQSAAVQGARSTQPEEYWHLAASAARALASPAEHRKPLFPKARADVPAHARWFVDRMGLVTLEQMRGFVRILDSYLNNTSLILLFEVNGKRLLFPGDAQIENWSYALANAADRRLLADVDLYKVGHHGSLNATPKTLWNGFRKKGQRRKLTTLLSTLEHVHGDEEAGTEVPRQKLVDELSAQSTMKSTQTIPAGTLCVPLAV